MEDARSDNRSETSELIRALRRASMNCLLAGDAPAAEIVISEAIDAGLDERVIDEHVIAPAMQAGGRHVGGGPAQRRRGHLATEISLRVLALQRERFRVAARRGRQRVMLAAVEGERHVLGLQMAANQRRTRATTCATSAPTCPRRRCPASSSATRRRCSASPARCPSRRPCSTWRSRRCAGARPRSECSSAGRGVPAGMLESDWLLVTRSVADAVEQVDALVQRPSLN